MNSPLFLDQPLAIHLRSYYEDQMDRREDIESRLKEEQMSPQERVRLQSVLENLTSLLSDEGVVRDVVDPLAVYWEKCIERGEEPDLDMTIEELSAMGEI